MNKLSKIKFPTFLGLIVLTVGLAAGVLLVQNARSLIIGAEPSAFPENVRVSNVSHSSFTVTFTTEKKVRGDVVWGQSSSFLGNTSRENESYKGFTHSITVTNLKPESTYYFSLIVEADKYDNNGVPWQVKTGTSLSLPKKPFTASGVVLSPNGTPVKNALVYATVAGSNLLSTVTGSDGSFFLPISFARTKDLQNYIEIDDKGSLIEISIHAGFEDIAFAQIYPRSANPIPPIIMNQINDFRNISPNRLDQIPEAETAPPEEATPSSGFEDVLGTFDTLSSEPVLDKTQTSKP